MAEMKIGVIGLPGKWSSETLADAVEARTGYRRLIDMQDVTLDLRGGRLLYAGEDLCELDGLIVKKITREYSPATLDRLEMLRVAEGRGVRVFSGAVNMLRLIDRLSCSVSLAAAGIPMPATRVTSDVTTACETVESFGEAVFKPLYSTKARGMTLVSAVDGIRRVEAAVRTFHADNPVMYIQQRLDLRGRDFGMVFLGGEYLGSYARETGTDSWNTTIHHGGRYAAYAASPDLVELGRRAQALFGLDFTTVDVALTDDGPIVFEVSAFGGFRGAQEGIGIDAAARYVEYVIATLGAGR